MKRHSNLILLVCLALALGSVHQCFGVLATAWHIPDGDTNFGGLNMRSPEFEIGTNTTVMVWSGVWKWSNGGSTLLCNQTGGWVFYKGATQSSWSSNALTWQTNFQYTTGNQYWNAPFNTTNFGTDDVIQYYLLLTLDGTGTSGATNTCLYAGGDFGSLTTGSQSVAAASPFTIRNRAAWLFHDGNRVVTANANGTNSTVSFWIQMGYQSKDAGIRWASNGCIYYTTDGSTPAGSLGVGSGLTQVMPLDYDHEQDNSSIAGNAMWWVGTVTNLPNYTAINYKIGVWNSANNEEKFADYNAGTPNAIFSFSIGATTGTNGVPVLTVDGMNADYTTEHLFVNEVAGDSIPVTVVFSPNTNNVIEADVYSDLNRRSYVATPTVDANGNPTEEGICPPNGNTIATGDDTHYYKAYPMTYIGGGQYSLTLNATNCGAYRVTARCRVLGNTNWFWYGLRDHCIVVTPTRARNMTMYELNAMNIDSQGTNQSDRSTFTDLYNGPGSRPYDPVTNRFNLQYVQNLGVNWLWLQPIHPIGIENRQINPNTGGPYAVGSPYSVKNYFQVNPLLSKADTRAAAMQEFTNFVVAANAAAVNVMLDLPFAHSAWDCELDSLGINLFAPAGQPSDLIVNDQPLFYSRTNEYDQRATSAGLQTVAPDRYDFGKWTDVSHVYSGRYAALVPNASQSGDYLSETDWFDYSIGSESGTGTGYGHFDPVTQNVWRYFSDCLLYWLDQTGCPTNTPPNLTASRGIGGLRADFGQGLAPQCWEYLINKVRCRKWDFVFMTESLDGGNVTYRSNRHFDVLNENLIFDLQNAATASDYRNDFDARRTAYGQSVILLNNDSHDEESYADPFEALIRYMACSAIDGAPMIFYGEELGISTTFGFNSYQLNFGKTIPQFMDYNSLQPIFTNRANGVDFLWPVYAALNQARGFSAAIRNSNRYYLNQIGSGNPQPSVFSVAKYVQPNGSPNLYDVVFAFANLDRNNQQQGFFNVNITQNGANLFGIKPGRTYNVRNIAAYTAYDANRRNYWLWGAGGVAGSNVLANGVFVSLNPVPTANSGWTNAPFEAQYLKLYDVTPPAAPAAPSTPKPYALGTSATFSWPPLADPDGGISAYHIEVGTSPGASNVLNLTVVGTTVAATNTYGQTLYACVSAINNAGIEGPFSPNSAGTILLDPGSIRLTASFAATSITLSWPGNLNTNFTALYSATNLTPPPNWLPTPGAPFLSNQQWWFSTPMTNGPTRFYRLQLD